MKYQGDKIVFNDGSELTTGSVVSEVDTIAELRLLSPPKSKSVVFVRGYWEANDGGGGAFQWIPASSKEDNSGTIIRPSVAPVSGRWERDGVVIPAEWFGVMGNGSDESAALSALLSNGAGRTLVMGAEKTYRFNPANQLVIQSGTNILSQGCIFKETIANTQYPILINGSNVSIDFLNFEAVGISNAQYNERGIHISGSGIIIKKIKVTSAIERTGANSGNFNAVRIGPDSGIASGVHIGDIDINGWEYPYIIQNLDGWTVGNVSATTYKRAGYIKDCKRGTIYGGYVKGINSAASTGKAGENGLLIEATLDHYSTEDVRIYNYDVEDAGEHGIRLGGGLSMRNIWLTNCSSKNHGAGFGTAGGSNDDDHGGCGFKVLGPTISYGARHEAIYIVDCIAFEGKLDEAVGSPWRPNFAGFQIGKCYGAFLINPTVKPSISTSDYTPSSKHTCINGIEIIGCENTSVVNPQITGYREAGIMFYDAANTASIDWGVQTNVKVSGGNISSGALAGVACIEFRSLFNQMRRVTIDGTMCESGENAIKVVKSGGGALIGCSASLTAWNQTLETLSGCEDLLINARGQTIGANVCRPGSTINDWGGGTLRVRETGGWGTAPSTITLTISDDNTASFTPRNSAQIIAVASQASSAVGMAWIRTSGAASIKLAGGSTFAVLNTVLTGTSGIDGNLTVSGAGNVTTLENRTGAAVTLSITQLG